MSREQADDSLLESQPLPGNSNSTEQEIYEPGEAQNVLASSNDTSVEGPTLLIQRDESPGDDRLNSTALNSDEGYISSSNAESTRRRTEDHTETDDERTPHEGDQGALAQEWSFGPSTAQEATADREDLTVHQAIGLGDFRNDTPSSEGDSGTRALPTNLQNTGTSTPILRGGPFILSANTRDTTSSTRPSILPDDVSSGTRTISGFTLGARTSPQSQRHSNLSSSFQSRAGTGFLSNNPPRTSQQPPQPGQGSIEHTSNVEPSVRNTPSRIEKALITLTNRIAAIEQKADSAIAINLTNQETQNKLDIISIDSKSSNASLTKIMGALERSIEFQESIIARFRTLDEAVSGYNENINVVQNICTEVNNRMLGYRTALDEFKHAWDVNRRLVNSYQEVIFSLVSWLEPTALVFRSLGRVFGDLAFWQDLRIGGDYTPPLPAGNQDDVDGDESELMDGNEIHGNGDAGIQGAWAGAGEHQPTGNQAPAQPAPGQYGSLFRAAMMRRWSYLFFLSWSNLLFLIFLFGIAKIIVAPYFHFRNTPDITSQQVSPVAPTIPAYPAEPVMMALLKAQDEAQAIAELASQSAEHVVACANLARDAHYERIWSFKSLQRRMKMDPAGKCKRAFNLSTQATLKAKIMARRLEGVFGEKWWVTAESKAEKT